MTHGSLFSGIGGFDLAAQWMGWENVFHCEWNPFGQRILKHYWPNAKSYGDITKTDFTIHRGTIDVLTGGFPCQPYSAAGLRKGKEDDRHLWPEMLRAIREVQPRWIIGENVPGLLNWNKGLVLDEIKADLEAAGFEVLPPLVLPACGLNAPHRRDRVWIVANTISSRTRGKNGNGQESGTHLFETFNTCKGGVVTNGNEIGLSNEEQITELGRLGHSVHYVRNLWEKFPTESPVCSGDDGIPRKLDGVTFSKWRNESIKGFGNAVVPELVLQIFKAIEQYEASLR